MRRPLRTLRFCCANGARGGQLTASLVGSWDGALLLIVARVRVIREAVPDKVPDQRADARVQQVLQKDVLDVLRPDAAGAEDGESGLHEEDERTRPHQVEGVELRVVCCHLRAADSEWGEVISQMRLPV